LENEGYEVITAYEGKSGINKAINEHPDLILLDIMMPEVTGIDVCKTLVANNATADIPIILVTAKSDAEDTREGLEAGAFDYIKKPFNQIELLARINSALKLAEAHKLVLEVEKKNTFTATVVTTNHKIKQPLTLITLTAAAVKRELNKETVSKEAILKKLEYIEIAVNEINDVLNKMHAIKQPVFSEYVKNIKMIDVDKKE
jgi:DNA-binding response OmpR family regulator